MNHHAPPVQEPLPELPENKIEQIVEVVEKPEKAENQILNLKDLFDVEKNKTFEFVTVIDADGNS